MKETTCTPKVAAVEPLKPRLEDPLPVLTINFADADDLFYFQNMVKLAKRDGGTTPSALTTKLACQAIARAKIV